MEKLNQIKKMMVQFANESGINLQKEFGTVEKFNDFVIAFSVKVLVDAGLSVEQSLDTCLGKGTYQGLVEKIYELSK